LESIIVRLGVQKDVVVVVHVASLSGNFRTSEWTSVCVRVRVRMTPINKRVGWVSTCGGMQLV